MTHVSSIGPTPVQGVSMETGRRGQCGDGAGFGGMLQRALGGLTDPAAPDANADQAGDAADGGAVDVLALLEAMMATPVVVPEVQVTAEVATTATSATGMGPTAGVDAATAANLPGASAAVLTEEVGVVDTGAAPTLPSAPSAAASLQAAAVMLEVADPAVTSAPEPKAVLGSGDDNADAAVAGLLSQSPAGSQVAAKPADQQVVATPLSAVSPTEDSDSSLAAVTPAASADQMGTEARASNEGGPVTPAAAPASPATASASSVATGAGLHRTDSVMGQVIEGIDRAMASGDGVHRLSLQLKPESLGEVRIILSVHQGDVRVRLAGDHNSHQVLQSGLIDLQRALDAVGLKDARIDLDPQRFGADERGRGFADAQSDLTGQDGRTTQEQNNRAGTRGDHPATDGASDGVRMSRQEVARTRATSPAGLDMSI